MASALCFATTSVQIKQKPNFALFFTEHQTQANDVPLSFCGINLRNTYSGREFGNRACIEMMKAQTLPGRRKGKHMLHVGTGAEHTMTLPVCNTGSKQKRFT
ncbi:hypothetical protein CBL_03593 [Carabus blaptoides fortunei]